MKHPLFMYISRWGMLKGAPGLSLFSFDEETGEIAELERFDESRSFGCSCIDQKRNVLYICNECDLFPETSMNSGRLYAYRINPENGNLTEINHAETYCPFPSYVNLDPEGKYLITPNHSWATFTTSVVKGEDGVIRPVVRTNDSIVNLFEVNDDGSIGKMVDIAHHQAGKALRFALTGKPHIPHPHCAMRSPDGKFFAVCDKGDGHIYLYSIESGKLVLKSRTLTDTKHSEPRYCMFHPTKPYLYVNHEHTPGDILTMTTFRYDENGQLTEVDKLYCETGNTQPKEPHRQMQGMCISPDGRYVYSQAHGYNLILVFGIEENTGALYQIQNVPVDGIWPRSLTMSPDGRFLINCCLAGTISVYRVNADGTLTDTGNRAHLQGSAYISFYQPES